MRTDIDLIERVTGLLPSEQDAEAIREMARDLAEIVQGVQQAGRRGAGSLETR